MSQYQLPCEKCGQVIPVSVTVAGGAVTCPHCGHKFSAPKLGAIRNLPPVTSAAPQVRNKSHWGPESGILFAGGFALLIVGVVGWVSSYVKYQTPAAELARLAAGFESGKFPDFNDFSRFEAVTKQLSVDQLWTEWREGLKSNLGEWKPFRSRVLLNQIEEIQRYLVGFGIVTGVGLLLCISSFLFMRKSPVQRQ